MVKTLPVRLYVLEDPSTGEVVLVPDEAEIEDMRTGVIEERERAQQLPARRRDARLRIVEEMAAQVERVASHAERARQYARVLEFTLRIPTYGECDAAEGDATTVDPDTGEVRVDERRLMRALLPECVQGHTRDEVLELLPAVAVALWQRLRRAIRPQTERLPFLLRRLGTGKPADSRLRSD